MALVDSHVALREIRVAIPDLPARAAGLRIAHVSDFHFRRWNRMIEAAQNILLNADYDFVAATGDFGTSPRRWKRTARFMRRFFEPVADRAPVYGALGNHDGWRLADVPDFPITILKNESAEIARDGWTVRVGGVDQTRIDNEDIEATLPASREGDVTVLLAHYPSTVFRVPPGRVDLQLSGHTHGGQIRLPRVGCIWPNDRISRRMARGLHAVGDVLLHISPGIGVSMPLPVRMDCPAEVTILTLEAASAAVRCVVPDGLPGDGGEKKNDRAYKV